MQYNVCVVGLGYVGLPVALRAAEKGHAVYGFDINEERVKNLSEQSFTSKDIDVQKQIDIYGKKITYSTNPDIIKNANVVIVCVPTPVNKDRKPNLNPLKAACTTINNHRGAGTLIIIESTIFPGTVEEVLKPLFTGNPGQDYFLAHCPERIDIGNKDFTLATIPRVVGGITEECAEKAEAFYKTIIDAPITILQSIKAVETTKIVENTFRDVNIALVNELARSFDNMNIDMKEVLKGAATKPFAFLAHYPGCGVGGHCIAIDPYYLIERSEANGFHHRFLKMARQINEEMPLYTIMRAEEALMKRGKTINNTQIAVLGLAYKAEIDDMRESPALKIIQHLKERGATINIYDPYIPQQSTTPTLQEALQQSDCIIIATDHKEFKAITPQQLKQAHVSIVIDGRNCLNKKQFTNAGIIYRGIGS
jgi:UDP-N-acetyl-D-glucosamine dehydrogenase